MTELNDKQKKWIDANYTNALKIGESFKSSVLHDDDKETIAVMNLIRAAKTFDETRVSKYTGKLIPFSTWLYTCVWTALLSADKGVLDKKTGKYRPLKHKLPRTKLLSESIYSRVQANWRSDDDNDVSEFASLFPYYDRMNELEFSETLAAITSRLNDRQRFIFKALLDPVGMKVPITTNKSNFKVTLRDIATMVGVTKQHVSNEIDKIRSVVEYVLKNEDKDYFRVAPKERDNG